MLAIITSCIIVIQMRRHLSWRLLLPILITFLVVSYFAVQFVAYAGDGIMKRILGIVLIIASLYFFFVCEKIKLPSTLPVQVSMGTLSGIMGGLFGMQGPPAVLYFLSSAKSKEQYIALAQTYFLIGNLMMTFYRAQHGFLTASVCKAWCFGIIGVLIGTWLGNIIFKMISVATLRKIVYLYMFISGLLALLR